MGTNQSPVWSCDSRWGAGTGSLLFPGKRTTSKPVGEHSLHGQGLDPGLRADTLAGKSSVGWSQHAHETLEGYLICLQGRWRGRRFLPGQGLADLDILYLHRTNANPSTDRLRPLRSRGGGGEEGVQTVK